MCSLKESGAYKTWKDLTEEFSEPESHSAIQDSRRQLQTLRKRSREERVSTKRLQRSTCSNVDRELKR